MRPDQFWVVSEKSWDCLIVKATREGVPIFGYGISLANHDPSEAWDEVISQLKKRMDGYVA